MAYSSHFDPFTLSLKHAVSPPTLNTKTSTTSYSTTTSATAKSPHYVENGYPTYQAPRPKRLQVGSALRELKPLHLHREHKVSPLSLDEIDAIVSTPSEYSPEPKPTTSEDTPQDILQSFLELLQQDCKSSLHPIPDAVLAQIEELQRDITSHYETRKVTEQEFVVPTEYPTDHGTLVYDSDDEEDETDWYLPPTVDYNLEDFPVFLDMVAQSEAFLTSVLTNGSQVFNQCSKSFSGITAPRSDWTRPAMYSDSIQAGPKVLGESVKPYSFCPLSSYDGVNRSEQLSKLAAVNSEHHQLDRIGSRKGLARHKQNSMELGDSRVNP